MWRLPVAGGLLGWALLVGSGAGLGAAGLLVGGARSWDSWLKGWGGGSPQLGQSYGWVRLDLHEAGIWVGDVPGLVPDN